MPDTALAPGERRRLSGAEVTEVIDQVLGQVDRAIQMAMAEADERCEAQLRTGGQCCHKAVQASMLCRLHEGPTSKPTPDQARHWAREARSGRWPKRRSESPHVALARTIWHSVEEQLAESGMTDDELHDVRFILSGKILSSGS